MNTYYINKFLNILLHSLLFTYILQDPISAGTWHKLTLVGILLHTMAVCMSSME